eukprot:6495970-Prymnesium_polylepis.1
MNGAFDIRTRQGGSGRVACSARGKLVTVYGARGAGETIKSSASECADAVARIAQGSQRTRSSRRREDDGRRRRQR